jgi:hypothetical protein
MARAIVESSSSVVNDVATGEVNEKSEASSSSHNGFGPLWHLFTHPTVEIWKCLMMFSKTEL